MKLDIPHTSPQDSKAHRVLCATMAEEGVAEDSVREFLWLLNVDDRLPLFVPICENLIEILCLMREHFGPSLMELAIPIDLWQKIAEAVVDRADELAESIGAHVLTPPESRRDSDVPEDSRNENPLVGSCATRNALYACLLEWHESQNGRLHRKSDTSSDRDRFLLLMGQLLVAHALVCRGRIRKETYESHRGAVEIDYPSSPYGATLALRALSRKDVSPCLRNLDPKRPPKEFADDASRYVAGRDELSRRLAVYCRFIARARDPRSWRKRRRRGDTRRGGGGTQWIRGYVDLGPDRKIVPTHIGDADDPAEDWGEQTAAEEVTENGKPISKARAHQLLRDDVYPAELADEDELVLAKYPCKEAKKGIAGLVFAARGQARHTAMENQLLPWRYRQLTASELTALLVFCSDRFRELLEFSSWDPAQRLLAETIALLHVMLWSGSEIERARALQILPPEEEVANGIRCELGLSIAPGSEKKRKSEGACWRVKSYFPPYTTTTRPAAGIVRPRTAYVTLPDIAGGASFLEKLMQRPEYRPSVTPFSRRIGTYRPALRRLLKEVDPSGRLTEHKIASDLFHRITCAAGELTHAVALTGQAHGLARARLFYTTPSVSRLRESYVRAVRDVAGSVYRAAGRTPPREYADTAPDSGKHVGSRYCPTPAAVSNAIAKLKYAIGETSPYTTRPRFIEYHNLFTLYTVLMFCYASACRAIHTPYISLTEIDFETGLASLADKDGPDHHKSRLVWLPHSVREQMRMYHEHRESVLVEFHDALTPRPVSAPECFFLRLKAHERVALQTVRPVTISSHLEHFLPLPPNTHRRFLRTELSEAYCPSEVIDALLGHWSRGEEPFGRYSSFSFGAHVEALKIHLVPLLEGLGFVPLASALVN